MEATAKKAIIYDNTCPLCVWYTGAFVKTGMLEHNNRISFDELASKKELTSNMDMHRSKHEIPLVDLEGGKTLYGLDSLAFILGQKIPFIAWVLEFAPIRTFFKVFYNIVSYNRRVIVGAGKTSNHKFDCTPDFHVSYRLIYIILAFLIGIVGSYAFGYGLVYSDANPVITYLNLLVLGSSFVAWSIYSISVVSTLFDKRKLIAYFGQLATMQLMGLGIYAFFTTIAAFFPIPSIAPFISAFAITVSSIIMFREHYRRLEVVNLAHWRIGVWTISYFVGVFILLST